jgi:hypothetical protein
MLACFASGESRTRDQSWIHHVNTPSARLWGAPDELVFKWKFPVHLFVLIQAGGPKRLVPMGYLAH